MRRDMLTMVVVFVLAIVALRLCVACGDALEPGPDAGSEVDAEPEPDAGAPDAPPDGDPYACMRDGCCETCCRPDNQGTANCCSEPPEVPDPDIELDVTICTWWPGYADAGVP